MKQDGHKQGLRCEMAGLSFLFKLQPIAANTRAQNHTPSMIITTVKEEEIQIRVLSHADS